MTGLLNTIVTSGSPSSTISPIVPDGAPDVICVVETDTLIAALAGIVVASGGNVTVATDSGVVTTTAVAGVCAPVKVIVVLVAVLASIEVMKESGVIACDEVPVNVGVVLVAVTAALFTVTELLALSRNVKASIVPEEEAEKTVPSLQT